MSTRPTIVTADLQLAEGARDAYRFCFINEYLPALVKKHNAQRVLILGDLTEEKDRHSAALTNAITESLYRLSAQCEVMILQGNHDFLVPEHPFFQFVGRLRQMAWISKPKEWTMDGMGDCLFLPFERAPDWEGYDFGAFDWVFCHQTFIGANMGGWNTDSGVDASIFPAGCKVVAGDIHVPQNFGAITYAGAPYTVDFGDNYQGRVLFIRDDKLTSLDVKLPQKRLLEYKLKSFEAMAQQERGYPVGATMKGDIVKVRINLESEQYARWHEIKESVYKWGEEIGYEMHAVLPVITQQQKRALPTIKSASRKSDSDLLREYSKRHGVDKDTLAVGLRYCE